MTLLVAAGAAAAGALAQRAQEEVTSRSAETSAGYMKLVIVTGAGASTLLGPDGQPMALMPTWCRALRGELAPQVPHLETTLELTWIGTTGEAFERAVGSYQRWARTFDTIERYMPTGHVQGRRSEPVTEWLRVARNTAKSFQDGLTKTLYRLFDLRAIDEHRAHQAYASLLRLVYPTSAAAEAHSTLVFATTNYDPAIEVALLRMGLTFDDGRSSTVLGTPKLDPRGMIDRMGGNTIPVLHLHGSVGWYRVGNETDETIDIHGYDKDYNPTLGVPALLMPDPQKDPASEKGVSALWVEFRKALSLATHVLVAGHALHDEHLVDAIREAIARGAHVGVTFYRDPNQPIDGDRETRDRDTITAQLPGAVHIAGQLGPDVYLHSNALQAWRLGTYKGTPGMETMVTTTEEAETDPTDAASG